MPGGGGLDTKALSRIASWLGELEVGGSAEEKAE
jgi:hypothetical protein